MLIIPLSFSICFVIHVTPNTDYILILQHSLQSLNQTHPKLVFPSWESKSREHCDHFLSAFPEMRNRNSKEIQWLIETGTKQIHVIFPWKASSPPYARDFGSAAHNRLHMGSVYPGPEMAQKSPRFCYLRHSACSLELNALGVGAFVRFVLVIILFINFHISK